MATIASWFPWLLISCLCHTLAAAGDGEPVLLLSNIRPIHYNLWLEPFLNNSTFDGRVQIEIAVAQDTSNIVLHAHQLSVTGAVITHGEAREPLPVKKNATAQTISLEVPKKLQGGAQAVLDIAFTGTIQNSIAGFFNSKFTRSDGFIGAIASTHMFPSHARTVFPCFDEPAQKAAFTITLLIDAELECASNMNVANTTVLPSAPGKKEVAFSRSPPMSTYLVAFSVGELSYIENTETRVPIRAYTSPEQDPKHMEYATHILARGLAFYEKLFGIEYALPKLDVFAVPTYLSGAMENWGLISSTSSAAPYDPNNDSDDTKQEIAEILLHELAHQWFGNLVTMQWWDQTWLNEGGASAMTKYCLKHLEPSWSTRETSLLRGANGLLTLDAFRSSHPIQVPILDGNDVNQAFGRISYIKGSSVLLMIQELLTEEVFYNGISLYLKDHAYRNTETIDLWAALSEASGQDVNYLMNVWTDQTGYPIVQVVEGNEGLHLEQHRFLLTGDLGLEDDGVLWPLPLNIHTSKGFDKTIFRARSGHIPVDFATDDFYLLNSNYTFLYRTQYPIERLHKLSLAAHQGLITAQERVGLISDTCALAQAGYHKTSTCLDFIMSLQEDSYEPWVEIGNQFQAIRLAWTAHATISDSLATLFRKEAGRISHRLGWNFSSDDSRAQVQFKAKMFRLAGLAGDEDVVRAAKRMFTAYANGDNDAAPKSLLQEVFLVAMYNGGEDEYEAILAYLDATSSPARRRWALFALLATENEALIQRTLSFILSKKYSIAESNYILIGVQYSRAAPKMVWAWAQENWAALREQFPNEVGVGSFLVESTTRHLSSRDDLEALKRFIRERDVTGLEADLALSVEIVEAAVTWAERDTDDLESWLGLTEPGEL